MSDVILSLQKEVATHLKAGQQAELETARLLLSAAKKWEIDTKQTITPLDLITLVEKMIKQRKESIEYYQQGGRQQLADKEAQEINHLKRYLPEQMDEAQVEQAVKKAITDLGATTIKDMGKVMATLKTQLAGRADIGQVSQTVKKTLS